MSTIKLYRLGEHRGQDDLEPSCGVLDICENGFVKYRIVVDCGVIMTPPNLSLFEDGKQIDAVYITHMHNDHVGAVPMLAPYPAESARIFMTPPSKALLYHILKEGINVRKKNQTESWYSDQAMLDILQRAALIGPGEAEHLSGIKVFIHPTGHVPGAYSATFRVGGANIHYSGDECGHAQPGVLGAELLPKEWWPQIVAGSDCTYGADANSDNRSWDSEMERGYNLIARVIKNGGRVLAPSFAFHRSTVFAHELLRRGITKIGGRVFIDGSARDHTRALCSKTSEWCNLDQPYNLENAQFIDKKFANPGMIIERKMRKYVVITTPGNGGPGGPINFWRRHFLSDPNALIAFTGYVPPGTDGYEIIKAAKERDLAEKKGVPITLRVVEHYGGHAGEVKDETHYLCCRVEQIRIGSHNPRRLIIEKFRTYKPEVAILSHGSKKSLQSIEAELSGEIKGLHRADDIKKLVEINI